MNITLERQTQAYIWFCAGEQFFAAAKLLSSPSLVDQHIKLPRVHLCCHGMEITMKAALLLEGYTEDRLRNQFGHDLEKLWRDTASSKLRSVALQCSRVIWSKAKDSPQWNGKVQGDDPFGQLEAGICALSHQHDRASDFAFRYPTARELDGWHPYFHIDVFIGIVSWYLRSEELEHMDGYPSVPTFNQKIRYDVA